MTALAELVATSSRVSGTASRLAKVREIARLLGELSPEEISIAVSYLAGELPQGRIGVGYAALQEPLEGAGPPPQIARLSLGETDQQIAGLAAIAGSGSAARRLGERRRSLRSSLRRAARSAASCCGSWPASCVKARSPA